MRFLLVLLSLPIVIYSCGVKGPPLPALRTQKNIQKEAVGVPKKEEKKNDKLKGKSLADK